MPAQCVILVDDPLMATLQGSLWLDNLLVKVGIPRQPPFYTSLNVWGTRLYLTNVTLEGMGDGDGVQECAVCGFQAIEEASVYGEGAPARAYGRYDGVAPRALCKGPLFCPKDHGTILCRPGQTCNNMRLVPGISKRISAFPKFLAFPFFQKKIPKKIGISKNFGISNRISMRTTVLRSSAPRV